MLLQQIGEEKNLILMYVDDVPIASKDKDYISKTKKGIYAEYDMTYMGNLDKLWNVKITRTTA
jgi:hypothetical protein